MFYKKYNYMVIINDNIKFFSTLTLHIKYFSFFFQKCYTIRNKQSQLKNMKGTSYGYTTYKKRTYRTNENTF